MKYFILIFFLLNGVIGVSQSDTSFITTAVAEDGLRTKLKINSIHGDNINRLNIWIGGAMGPSGADYCGASYYIPKKHLLNLNLGLGIGFNGSLFLYNWESLPKQKRLNYDFSRYRTVLEDEVMTSEEPSLSDLIVYYVNIPTIKRKSFGIHYGSSFAYAGGQTLEGPSGTPFVSNLSLGVTFLSARHNSISNLDVGIGTYTNKLFSLNADVIYYFGHTNPKIFNRGGRWDQDELDYRTEKAKLNFGGRVYIEGYLSQKSCTPPRKFITGLRYMIGFGTKGFNDMIPIILGLGYNISINYHQ